MSVLHRKVLAVDDSEVMHGLYDLVFMKFKAEGLKVLHARNGLEALDALRANPDVDFVLLDVHMPVMDGLEFLGIVRASSRFARIPVVIVSTKGKEEDTERGMRAGATAYLTKPFHPSEVLQLMPLLLGGGRVQEMSACLDADRAGASPRCSDHHSDPARTIVGAGDRR